MATALLAFAGVGCVEPLEPVERDPNARDLIIRLSVPGQGIPVTKAGTGPVNGISPESQVYTVQVWAFNHHAADSDAGDSEKAVAYSTVDLGTTGWANTVQRPSGYYDEWSNTTTYEVPMTFPGYVLDRDAADMKFDFYVLANASSIGCTAGQDATRGTLKSLSFGGDNFGTVTPKTGATPTAILGTTGLPISGFFNKTKDTGSSAESPYVGPANGVDLSFLKTQPNITAAEMHKLVPVVQLQRAVSKIRFAFVRPKGMAGVQITKIVIDEKLIPDNTFVFPREDGTDGTSGYSYNTAATTIQGSLNGNTRLPLLADTDIKEMTDAVPDPKSLESTSETAVPGYSVNVAPKNMSAQQYSDLLNAFATSQLVYLRESGKKIKGKIYYKLSADGDEKSAVFEMDADDDDTNFYRNHYWIVYAYFLGGDLYVKPTVAPWEDTDQLSYTLKMNTNMRLFDSWLYRYDTVDQDYTNWTNWAASHMAVSEGRETDGRPSRSPQIQLVTTGVDDASVAGSGTFELRIDNKDFEIVKAVKNDVGVVTSYVASTDILEESVYQYGSLTIPAGDDVYTYFYIVPKATITSTNPPAKRVAKVSLVYNDPVLGPLKVTFNYSALPGYSDDSSEIWAYYFPANEYNITGKLKMYYQDYNNPLVPTPVQN